MNSFLLCTFLFSGTACEDNGIFHSKKEGTIIYDVTFPYAENSILLELYPKEMIFEFKGDQFHTLLKSSYGVVSTDFLIDNDSKTFTQLLKSFKEKYSMTLNEDETQEWLKQYPDIDIEVTQQTDSIAGYLCQKSIAHFKNDSVPDIELYTTKDIKISASNWWNKFNKLDGFLMGYEFEQYGKRMRLRAREVRFEKINEDHFAIPEGYVSVDAANMKTQIEQLLNEFMK